MKYKNLMWLFFISFVLLGCGSSKIDKFFQKRINDITGVAKNDGNINTQSENNITIDNQIQEALDAHNSARKEVGVENVLVWDDTIAKDAKSYADELAESGAWEHDKKNIGGYQNGDYGENLYTSTSKPTLKVAIDAWVDEKVNYHYNKIGDNDCDAGKICGHYTQVIWKDTSKVGCAMSKYKRGIYKNWYVVVCKYQTPGNVYGQTPY